MGSTLSNIVQEAKDAGGTDLVIEQQDKIKAKEIAVLIQHLESELPQLVSLTVNSSKIKKLPSETGQSLVKLKELIVLRLEDNQLSQLPDSIALLTKKLQELSLAGNKFTAFPGTIIGLLHNLQSLNFSKNQLSSLDSFSGHKTLEYLNLSNNQFTEFPVDVCAIPNLKKLSLCDNQISAVSEQIGKLVHLEHLELRGNKLTSLPSSLGKLTKLQHLDAAENEISSLPHELEALKHSLTSLELQHNKFTAIPACVFHLTALRSLKMNDNRIAQVPSQIGNLVELTELYLQENSIVAIPPEIAHATSLRKLYLEFNRISSLPSELRELKKLVVLILHHNEINTLPPAVRQMKTLLRFSLEHNPLDDKTLDIIRKDGALALIDKEEAPASTGASKYKTLNHSKSHRSIQSTSNYYNNNSVSANATPGSGKQINRRASTFLPVFEKEKDSQESSSSSLSEFPTDSATYRMRSRSTTVTDFQSMPTVVVQAPPSPESSPRERRNTVTVSSSEKDSVPNFSQFKTAFDTFLEDQDFSKEKSEALSKLPTEQKWSLMKEYKSSTLNMLKYNEKKPFSLSLGGPKSKKTTPQEYPSLLRGFRVLKDDLVTLNQCLSHNVDGWVAHFIEAGGILALIKLIEKHSLKKEQNYVDFILVGESLKCFKILLEVVLKTVLTTTDSVNTIALNITCSNFDCKNLSFELLEDISQIPYVGQGIVVEALKYHQKHKFPNSLPFDAMMKMLTKSAKDKTENLTLTIVSLINGIINNCDDLEQRFDLRKNFVNQGLLEIFKNFRKDISQLLLIQLDIFEENMFRDEEDMIQKYGRMEVWDRMRRNSNSDSIGDFIRVAAIVNPIQTPTGLIPYAADTVISKLIDNMCHMFGVEHPVHAQVKYGLFVYQGKEQGFWLEDQKKMGDYKFKGEIFSELKMRPWTCVVKDMADPTKDHKVVVDPNADCAAVVNQFLSQLTAVVRSPRSIKLSESMDEDNDEEEYQLFLVGAGVKGKPLLMDDTRKIYEYATPAMKLPQVEFPLIVFELQIKARALKVYLGSTEDTTIFYFLPSTSLHKIKKKILKQLMTSGEISKTYGNKQLTVEDYGVLVETPGNQPQAVWADETKKLSDFKRGITVRVMLKPRNFTVLLPTGQQKTVRVDLSKPVKQVIDEIMAEQKAADPNQLDYLLCYQPHSQNSGNVGSIIPLKLNKSFRDQRVPLDITLSMTPIDQNTPVEDDVNIWQDTEPVTYEDDQHVQISYATFNKLVEFLTSADDLHLEFTDVFFLTYKAFTTPQKLLDKFIERYKVPPKVETSEATKIKMRVCIVFKNWMENKYETNHNDIKDQVTEFINTLVKKDFPELVPALMKAVDRTKVAVISVGTHDAAPKPKLPKNLSDNITLLQIDPLELARQMTLQMFDIYKKINQTEFFGQAWTKPHKGLSPNLLKAIGYFNDVTCWVSTAIVSEKKIRDRVKVFEIFVKVAAELQGLNNFHLLFALITAFNTSAVSRLKWTKEKLSKRAKQLMAELEELMSMQGSFKKYREHLAKVDPPCIPYIGVYLTDLIFIEDGNPDKIGNRINFSKQLYMYKVLSTIQKFQGRTYTLVPVPSIQRFLDSAPKLDEKELYSLSQKVEPRGATRNDIE